MIFRRKKMTITTSQNNIKKKSGIISGFFCRKVLIKKSLFLKNGIELQLMHFRQNQNHALHSLQCF